MTNTPLSTILFIVSLTLFILAIVGNSKLAFIEVNPGCFGRLLALLFGFITLLAATALVVFPMPMLEGIKTQIAELLQQNFSNITQYITDVTQNS